MASQLECKVTLASINEMIRLLKAIEGLLETATEGETHWIVTTEAMAELIHASMELTKVNKDGP